MRTHGGRAARLGGQGATVRRRAPRPFRLPGRSERTWRFTGCSRDPCPPPRATFAPGDDSGACPACSRVTARSPRTTSDLVRAGRIQARSSPGPPGHRRPHRARRASRRRTPALGARRRRAGGLRQDDVAGAVGRAQAAAGGVAVGGRSRQRPDRAPDLSRRGPRSRGADRADGVPVAWLRRVPAWPSITALVASIASMQAPVAVVLDHAEALTNRACRDIIAELALRLPAGSQLAIGSRREVPVPVSLLRAQGGIVEIGVDDLAMSGTGGTVAARGRRCRARRGPSGRARRPYRGLAGGAVPRGAGDQRRISRGEQLQLDGRRSLRRRLSPIGVAPTCLACGRVVPHPHVDPRAHVGTAVRCHRWSHGIRSRARSAGAPQPPGAPAGSPRRVVPLSPSLPRAAARRADAARARHASRSSTPAPRRGTRRTTSPNRRSSMPSTRATPTGSHGWSSRSPTPCGPAGVWTPCCAGWTGSRPTI